MREMRTAGIALAAAVAMAADCWSGSSLGDDEARALLAGILDMANEAPVGTHAYACPLGGEATTTVTVATEQRGDTAYTIGEWEIRLPWNPVCRGLAEGYPGLILEASPGGAFHDPEEEDVWFKYEAAVLESGARRLRAVVSGGGGVVRLGDRRIWGSLRVLSRSVWRRVGHRKSGVRGREGGWRRRAVHRIPRRRIL